MDVDPAPAKPALAIHQVIAPQIAEPGVEPGWQTSVRLGPVEILAPHLQGFRIIDSEIDLVAPDEPARFGDKQIIIALGVTLDGQKIPLGFVQAATENEWVCRRFLTDLVDRGLQSVSQAQERRVLLAQA